MLSWQLGAATDAQTSGDRENVGALFVEYCWKWSLTFVILQPKKEVNITRLFCNSIPARDKVLGAGLNCFVRLILRGTIGDANSNLRNAHHRPSIWTLRASGRERVQSENGSRCPNTQKPEGPCTQ